MCVGVLQEAEFNEGFAYGIGKRSLIDQAVSIVKRIRAIEFPDKRRMRNQPGFRMPLVKLVTRWFHDKVRRRISA